MNMAQNRLKFNQNGAHSISTSRNEYVLRQEFIANLIQRTKLNPNDLRKFHLLTRGSTKTDKIFLALLVSCHLQN